MCTCIRRRITHKLNKAGRASCSGCGRFAGVCTSITSQKGKFISFISRFFHRKVFHMLHCPSVCYYYNGGFTLTAFDKNQRPTSFSTIIISNSILN